MHRIVVHRLLLRFLRQLMAVHDLRAAGDGVLLPHLRQLVDDDTADAGRLGQRVLQVGDLVGQRRRLRHALEDVLLVDVAQLDLRHILRLHLVDAEGDHQVGNDLRFLLRLPDGADGLVDVQQDALETLQQVQLVLLLFEDKVDPALDALGAPCRPLLQNPVHPQHTGLAGDEDIEVAADRVLQRGQAEQLGHQLVRVHAPLQVDGQLQAA